MERGLVDKDTEILAQFINIYCNTKHKESKKSENNVNMELCPDCANLLSYSSKKRALCPLNPKPACKKCHIHCYEPSMREKIREVMRHSGMYLIRRGRLGLILHYFF